MRKLIALIALLSISALIACSSKPNDDQISRNIQTKVSNDPAGRDSKVYVESKDGNVTLKGKTTSQSARAQLEKIAKEEPGVVSVDDQTLVEAPVAVARPAATPVPPPPPPPPPKPIVVPSGTVLTIRTDQAIGSKESQVGGVFSGSVATPITVDGSMVIPAGAVVTGVVKNAKKSGRFKGAAELQLALDSVTINGHKYNIETEAFEQTSTGKGKRTAGMVAGGTGVGAAIGGIAGGGKGAAIGALAGAGAGTIGAATGNRDIKLPAESALSFRLVQPLTLKPNAENKAGL